jgi:hypothetical protein
MVGRVWNGRKGLVGMEGKEMVGKVGMEGEGLEWLGNRKEWKRGGRHGDAAREAFLELSHHRVN